MELHRSRALPYRRHCLLLVQVALRHHAHPAGARHPHRQLDPRVTVRAAELHRLYRSHHLQSQPVGEAGLHGRGQLLDNLHNASDLPGGPGAWKILEPGKVHVQEHHLRLHPVAGDQHFPAGGPDGGGHQQRKKLHGLHAEIDCRLYRLRYLLLSPQRHHLPHPARLPWSLLPQGRPQVDDLPLLPHHRPPLLSLLHRRQDCPHAQESGLPPHGGPGDPFPGGASRLRSHFHLHLQAAEEPRAALLVPHHRRQPGDKLH